MKKQDLEDLKKQLNDLKETVDYTRIGVGLLLDLVIDHRRSCIKDLEGHPGFIPPSQILDLQTEVDKICGLQSKLFDMNQEEEENPEMKDCQSDCTEHKTCKEKSEEKKKKNEEK